MSHLERAIAIAVEAHSGQIDKAGAPYILHPLRVMLALTTQTERIVGVLHDVIEDCEDWTFARLAAEGFSEEILVALKSVTKHDPIKNPILSPDSDRPAKETYQDFVRRAAANNIGARVKRADLIDNMNWSRISSPTQRDVSRMERYKKALALLESGDRKSPK